MYCRGAGPVKGPFRGTSAHTGAWVGNRDILEKNLDIKNIRLSDFAHITEIGSMHVILQLLEKDAGITFLYRTAVEEGIKDGVFRELELRDFQMEHDFAFIWNKGSIYADTYRMICRELQ